MQPVILDTNDISVSFTPKMDVFNKIYSQVSSSVSSTVSQLSGVLPGNPVTREFDATTHIASAGPGLVWKIYKGYKRSTKQEASIFVFEKRQLEKHNRVDRDLILESLKRGITQLTKIRHPQILTVQHPLEESRESLAFATEPVFASLANIQGKNFNMPQPTNLTDYKLYDIEVKYGLLQITEGLAFLHNDVKLIHKNITPECIVINGQGVWKIFGFDFCVLNSTPPNQTPFYTCQSFSPTLPEMCQSCLEFLAPECILNELNTPASDMFSLGMLATLLTCQGRSPFNPVRDLSAFKERVKILKNLNINKLQGVPEVLREHVKLLLSVTPEVRPDAHQFAKIPYFDDVGIRTLTYLDSLLQWDNLQKSQFYKGLPEALPKLPQRVKVQRVLTCLSRDLTQPAMVPFILPSFLDIAQECTKEEYGKYVLPHLKPVMKLQEPIQILLILLNKMELLLKLTPAEDIQQHVLPMLYRGLDSDTAQVHELCLSVLPTFAGLLDHSNVKNSLLPRIKKLCLSTSTLSVRVNCLLCVGRLLEHLDKWLVLDEVLPFLPQIPSREPAVLMGILGIYKLAMTHKKLGISKEVKATRILPFLIPLAIENGLNLTQFNALVALIKDMFQSVETEHRTKLEQLNSVKNEAKVLEASMSQSFDHFMTQMKIEEKKEDLKPVKKPEINKPKSQTKDLTASLLSDWSNSSPLQPAANKSTSFNNNWGTAPPIPASNWNTTGTPIRPMASNWNAAGTPSGPMASNWNAPVTPSGPIASNWSGTATPTGPMAPNWNVTTTPTIPMASNWSPSNNNATKALSNDDIIDLLS